MAHAAPDVGVDHRRRGALVLPVLSGDSVRHRNLAFEPGGAELLLRRQLVRRVGVGIQEGDGDAGYALRLEGRDSLAHILFLDGNVYFAIGADALAHRQAQAPRHQRRRRLPEKVVHLVAVTTADFQNIAEPLGREKADNGALALQKGVQPHRRAMQKIFGAGHLTGFERLAEHVQDTFLGRIGRRRNLADQGLAGAVIVENEVGERPTDIHAHSCRHIRSLLPRETARASSFFYSAAPDCSTP